MSFYFIGAMPHGLWYSLSQQGIEPGVLSSESVEPLTTALPGNSLYFKYQRPSKEYVPIAKLI